MLLGVEELGAWPESIDACLLQVHVVASPEEDAAAAGGGVTLDDGAIDAEALEEEQDEEQDEEGIGDVHSQQVRCGPGDGGGGLGRACLFASQSCIWNRCCYQTARPANCAGFQIGSHSLLQPFPNPSFRSRPSLHPGRCRRRCGNRRCGPSVLSTLFSLQPCAYVDFDSHQQASPWPVSNTANAEAGACTNAMVQDATSAAGGGSSSDAANDVGGGQLVGRRVGRDTDGAIGRVLMAVAESDVVVVEWDNGDEEDLRLDLLRFL
jgi:hypothetical protein